MPFNLLLFPLVGGYYIYARFRLFKYLQQRLDQQRLLFNSIISGVFLLVVTFIIRAIVQHFFPNLTHSIHSYFPIKIPYFGTTAFSLLFAILFTEIGNLFVNREKAIKRSIKLIGNELELLFKSSFDHSHLLQFTLKNNKVYIGWVKELPLPSDSKYIRIIPSFSGFRNDEKYLVFTTDYLEVYAEYIKEGKIHDIHDLATDIIIRIDEIISANKFDIEMYERFNDKSD